MNLFAKKNKLQSCPRKFRGLGQLYSKWYNFSDSDLQKLHRTETFLIQFSVGIYIYIYSCIFCGFFLFLGKELSTSLLFLVCTWRHGGHVGVQNNSEKSLLGIWLYYYAKLERHFAIVLYTNMAASSRECNPRIYPSLASAKSLFRFSLTDLKFSVNVCSSFGFPSVEKNSEDRYQILWYPSSDFVSPDQFYPMRARRNYSVGYKYVYVYVYMCSIIVSIIVSSY